MLHMIALYVGYAVLVVGATAGVLALLGAILWWIAERVVQQWTSMDLFWQTCMRIAKERDAAKTPARAQAEYRPPVSGDSDDQRLPLR